MRDSFTVDAVSQPTLSPGIDQITIPLGARLGSRSIHLVVAMMFMTIGLLCTYGGIEALMIPDAEMAPVGRLGIAAAFAVVTALACGHAIKWLRQITFRRSSISVDADGLALFDPVDLAEPLKVPLNQLVAASAPQHSFGPTGCFPVYKDHTAVRQISSAVRQIEPPVGFLLSHAKSPFPPLLCGGSDINAVLLFAGPQLLRLKSRTGLTRQNRITEIQITGIYTSARDRSQFANRFAGLGVNDRLTLADFVSDSSVELTSPDKVVDAIFASS